MSVAAQYATHRRIAIEARLAGEVARAIAHENAASELEDWHVEVTLDLVDYWGDLAAHGRLPSETIEVG